MNYAAARGELRSSCVTVDATDVSMEGKNVPRTASDIFAEYSL